MEWELMRGTADGQEPGTEGGRSPTGGPGSCPSAAVRGPGDGQGETCPPATISTPEGPPDMPEEPPAQVAQEPGSMLTRRCGWTYLTHNEGNADRWG